MIYETTDRHIPQQGNLRITSIPTRIEIYNLYQYEAVWKKVI